MYSFDERFLEANIQVVSWPLSDVLLAKNAAYAWFVLVPRVTGATELIDLDDKQQQQLLLESNTLSRWIKTYFSPDKLNVAMLGNIVSTLHLHHVGRYVDDPAWPGPVWGHPDSEEYNAGDIRNITEALEAVVVS